MPCITGHQRHWLVSAAPIVSILTPVYRPDMDHFKACVGSVVEQTSSDWELILVDDASGDVELAQFLAKCAAHPSNQSRPAC